MFCSDYQLNELRGSGEEDEFFIDGTFDLCCENITQVVTLMRRRKHQTTAKPMAFALLQEKTENVYIHLWNQFIMHAPILKKLKKIYVHCDFELAMINAIHVVVPNAQVICCLFHLVKTVTTWIRKNIPSDHLLRDKEVQKELVFDLNKLAISTENWSQLSADFTEKYRAKSRAFSNYFFETYLNTADNTDKRKARFSPQLWARSQIGDVLAPDLTNNQAERFNKQMNATVKDVRTIKDTLKIIKAIEFDARKITEFELNHINYKQVETDEHVLNVAPLSKSFKQYQPIKKSLEELKRNEHVQKESVKKSSQQTNNSQQPQEAHEPPVQQVKDSLSDVEQKIPKSSIPFAIAQPPTVPAPLMYPQFNPWLMYQNPALFTQQTPFSNQIWQHQVQPAPMEHPYQTRSKGFEEPEPKKRKTK